MESQNKIRIAIFIDWYLPSYKGGGPIKSVASIVSMFKNNVDFHVITSDRDFGDHTHLPNIKLNEWVELKGAKVIYLTPENQTTNNYKKLLSDIRPQKIYFNSLFSKKFTLTPLKLAQKSFRDVEIIVAPRGMLGKGALKIKPIKKRIFLIIARRLHLFRNVTWHASTDLELEEIKENFGPDSRVKVAENLGQLPEEISRTERQNSGHLNLLFVSRISIKKNLLFVLECLNTNELRSSVSLTIVGPMEDQEYGKKCLEYSRNNNLNVTFVGGKSPQELRHLYNRSDLFILPTQHENYGHVILESLAHGTPVIISENTPWRNLEKYQVGFDLPLNIATFREKILFFIDQTQDQWTLYSKSALKFASEKINNADSIKANSDLFISKNEND